MIIVKNDWSSGVEYLANVRNKIQYQMRWEKVQVKEDKQRDDQIENHFDK